MHGLGENPLSLCYSDLLYFKGDFALEKKKKKTREPYQLTLLSSLLGSWKHASLFTITLTNPYNNITKKVH